MEGSNKEEQIIQTFDQVTTFPIPKELGEVNNNIPITNILSAPSKEELIKKVFKFHSQGNISKAVEYYQHFINQGFTDPEVFLNYGILLRNLGKLKEAQLSTRKAIELNPDSSIAHSNLGTILMDLGNLQEAQLSTRRAIELNPNFAQAHSNLGNILRYLGKLKEAELSTRRAIELNPNFAQAHSNLGLILKELGNFNDAINHYKKAIKIDNKLSIAKSGLIESKGLICDWSDQKEQKVWIDKLGIIESSINPISLFYYEDDPLKQLKRSRKFFQENFSQKSDTLATFKNKKIHIGYFSADFNKHATMYLIASILELHDKSKFAIYLYSFTPNEDNYTERAKKSGCFFRDIRKLTTIETVKLARSDKLDIAIDLKGYTQYCRMSIFSYRVAPIQINYLGYPGTLGADSMDYILADKIIIPEEYEKFYSEKILRMPSCYQCNDNTKEISKKPISRKDFNLPEKGFVFTCFNANKKITSKEFDIWMRLLSKVKKSVLWLYQSNKFSAENLTYEAVKRNIDPKRLIFTKELPLEEHLSRHTLGDLALDTFNYNGHTTTSDALWAGLPVLTKIGESFAARVSSSLLTSIGVPELITYSEKEYEEQALNIAINPDQLLKLKSKLKKSRDQSPLYNSESFTRDLEKIFENLITNQK